MDKVILISIACVAIIVAVLFYDKVAPSTHVIGDGELGKSVRSCVEKYGEPFSITDGYVSIGLKAEDRQNKIDKTLYWKTSGGHLYVYLSNGVCVESLWFHNDVQF